MYSCTPVEPELITAVVAVGAYKINGFIKRTEYTDMAVVVEDELTQNTVKLFRMLCGL